MSRVNRPLVALVAALGLGALAGCESSGYGGTTVSGGAYYGSGYYPGGYYPGYYPGYPCCYDGGDIIINPPDRPERPGNGGDRPTTLPAGPENLPSSRPTTRPAPAPAARPAPAPSARPAPRPTPRPMGGGGGRRR